MARGMMLLVPTENYMFMKKGLVFDITPIRATEALTDPFTTNGTATVLVTDAGHGCEAGSFVTFDSFSTIDGLDMNQEFEVLRLLILLLIQ
jgi:ribulose 1,5-bisphosphate synthetase/thiazole synthase